MLNKSADLLIKLIAIGAVLVLGLGLLFTIIIMAWATNTTEAAASEAGLNTSKVPKAYVVWIEEAGDECTSVSPPQIAAQIFYESSFVPNAYNAGPPPAYGLGQFHLDTWATYGRADAPGPFSPDNPGDAIMATGRYDCAIAAMLQGLPGDPLSNMLAGYNQGPQSVIDALTSTGVLNPAQASYAEAVEALIPQFSAPSITLDASGFAALEIYYAEKYCGMCGGIPTQYVWGGGDTQGPTTGVFNSQNPPGVAGFDCSGLVLYAVYKASGGKTLLQHSSEWDAVNGIAVPPSQLVPGDTIEIQTDGNNGDFSHVVIYLGGGEIIEAPTFGQDVQIAPLSDFDGDIQTIRWFGPASGAAAA
jgi:cell wall-associated NlpC family hydrolase